MAQDLASVSPNRKFEFHWTLPDVKILMQHRVVRANAAEFGYLADLVSIDGDVVKIYNGGDKVLTLRDYCSRFKTLDGRSLLVAEPGNVQD